VAEGITSESTVVDLLDFELRFAQGELFSPPRPARPEATQLGDEREEGEAPAAIVPPPMPAAAPFMPPRSPLPAPDRAPPKVAQGGGRP
jgi:cyclic-di-GMP phosphodiesterase TipF (flagellum assembly factor)